MNNRHTFNSCLFFDLFNPPIINWLKQRSNYHSDVYTLKHRNLNLWISQPQINVEIIARANVRCLVFENECSELQKIISNIHFCCSEKAVFFSSVAIVSKRIPTDPVIPHIKFSSTYMMAALLKRSFILLEPLLAGVLDNLSKVATLSGKNPKALEKALIDVLL